MKRVILRKVTYPVVSSKIPPAFDGFRLAVLADLHNCTVGQENRVLIDALRKAKPDAILLAGDMITEEKRGERRVLTRRTYEFLKEIRGLAPIYYGLGNHEERWKKRNFPGRRSFEDWKEEMMSWGIMFLDNDSVQICRGKDALRVSGLSLTLSEFRGTKTLTAAQIRQLIGKADRKHFQILLAHNPTYGEVYGAWGADLTLAGHFHGGVIRLPKLGGVIATNLHPFPRFDRGRYRLKYHGEMIVTSGLGSHTIPIRVNNPPELVMISLRRKA